MAFAATVSSPSGELYFRPQGNPFSLTKIVETSACVTSVAPMSLAVLASIAIISSPLLNGVPWRRGIL